MKVLHVLAQLPMRTGSGVYFSNLLEGLSHDENHIQNGLIYGVQEPFDIQFDQVSYPIHFKTAEVPFPIVGMSDEMPYENTVYSEMSDEQYQIWKQAFQRRLNQAKEEFQPDIVVSHHLWYLTSLVLDTFSEIPVIGISHGTDIRQALQNPTLKNQYVHQMNRLDLVFALSNKDKSQIKEVFGVDEGKILITAAGFNQNIFNTEGLSKDEDKINIVYAGKIAHAKGVYELAQAFPKIKASHPEVVLHYIGSVDDENRKLLHELADYSEDFLIYDAENQKVLADCMKKCDIFVLPSYYEGMGLIAIEALACQLRVVVTEIKGLIELLGPNINQSDVITYVELPRLYDQDKPIEEDIPAYIERLEHAICHQIRNIKKNREFPQKIYDNIYRHSWSEVVKLQLAMIDKVYQAHYSQVTASH